MMRVAVLATAVLLSLPVFAAERDPYKRLLRTIERDDAYKVRMQAIRVLSRRLDKSKRTAPDRVIAALGQAASIDESYIVRGMAVVALGRLADPRTRPFLENARSDEESFVRKQVEQALALTPLPAPPPLEATKRSLIVGYAEQPGGTTPSKLRDAMIAELESGFRDALGEAYAIDDGVGATGFSVKGSIAERSVRPEGGEQRVTVAIKLTVATWPENNLREVLSAKASAKTKTKNAVAIEKLQRKLLEAAVKRVVKDSMTQIRGG